MTAASVIAGDGSRLDVSARPRADRREASTTVERVAAAGLCLLVLAAPYEALDPLIVWAGQSLSTVEAVLLLVVAAWAVTALAARRLHVWRTTLTAPCLAFLAVCAVAAVGSEFPVNALHMTARFALAFVVLLVAVSAGASRAQTRGILVATTISAVVVSLLIVLEYTGASAALDFLGRFRSSVAVIGGDIRASGPFQYPTIASMALEIAFAFALGLLLAALDAGRATAAGLLILALALIGEGIVLTFTRAGLITMATSLAIVGGLRIWRRGVDRSLLALGAVAALVLSAASSSRSLETTRLRLTTEAQNGWFSADIAAPVSLQLRTGARISVPIRITNTGRAAWDPAAPNPVRLSYHWLDARGLRVVVWEGNRTELPSRVVPGATVDVVASVRAPNAPGQYALAWDLEQVHRLWFSTEPGAALPTTSAAVDGAIAGPVDEPRIGYLPRVSSRPGRGVLWRAAWRMLSERPWLGVGPDNFRLLYGRYAGLANADSRVHSNSLYLELIVGTGIAGSAALCWLVWRAGGAAVAASVRGSAILSGVVAAAAAIAVHGLVDSFLGFTATYILIALTLGLLASATTGAGERHAHRI